MSDNKTVPTQVKVQDFLEAVGDGRRAEAERLISAMRGISGQEPVMWGPSIIGFGSKHYKYDTGREGDVPQLGFSPRKGAITIYFNEGFDRYGPELERLGKHKTSVSCLYVNKLDDLNMDALESMLKKSYALGSGDGGDHAKPGSVEEYIASIPDTGRARFDELRKLVRDQLPEAEEILSYGIVGYRAGKRNRLYISGWKDHVAMYPTPKNEALRTKLKAYIKGKGTLWFPLDKPLPEQLIRQTVNDLAGTQ